MVSEPDTGRCVNEEAEPQRGMDTRQCTKARTLGPEGEVPHQLKKGTSASEDAQPLKGVDYEIPYRLGRRTKHHLQRVWKPLPSRRVLKTLRESLKGKVQRGQYLLAAGLSGYKHTQ